MALRRRLRDSLKRDDHYRHASPTEERRLGVDGVGPGGRGVSESCRRSIIPIVLLAVPALSATASAHGESLRGVGGVGANTTGGEVATRAAVYFRYDVRSYQLFSDAELLEFQRQSENVHQHSQEHSVFLGGTLAIAPNWDLSVLLQANRFVNFADNGDQFALRTMTLSRTDVSQGLGDMVFLGRYQLFHRGEQHLAALAGVKLPTGDVRQRTNQGDIVGTHNQPGSGSVDFQLGAAYSGEAFDMLLISADVIGRVNTEGAGSFRSGNSLQLDMAVGTRLFSLLVPSVELNAFFQQQDIEQDEVKKNSGVSSLFLTPAVRLVFGQHFGFVASSYPLWQSFPGISNHESLRISAGYGFSFGAEDHHSLVATARPQASSVSLGRDHP